MTALVCLVDLVPVNYTVNVRGYKGPGYRPILYTGQFCKMLRNMHMHTSSIGPGIVLSQKLYSG